MKLLRLAFIICFCMPCVAQSADEEVRWTDPFDNPDILCMGIGNHYGRDVRKLLSEWTKGFRQGDMKVIADQWDIMGAVTDASGITVCCGPRAVEASLLKDYGPAYAGKKPVFEASDIWWIWKATQIYVTDDSPRILASAALVHIIDETNSLSSRRPLKIFGLLRRVYGKWQWFAVWPFLPDTGRSFPKWTDGLLDGTAWSLPEMDHREDEFLIFEGGRLISGTSSGNDLHPVTYAANRVGDKIVWTAEQSNQAGDSRSWRGQVTGTTMVGEDRLVQPRRHYEQSWSWTAARAE